MAIRQRQRLRRELITRTAQIWSKLNKRLIKDLNKISQSWINELFQNIDTEFPKEFTEILKSNLREALAYGYWLQWLYLYELRGNKYRGKITLAEGDNVKESVQKFMNTGEWNDVIPQKAADWINNYVPKLSGNFSYDVLDKTRDIIKNSLLEGSTVKECSKALQEVLDVSKTRIEAIARTEITRAHNLGNLTAMKANNDVIGVEFSAVLDNRTTPMCSERHGLRMRLDDPRIAENTPPIHVNCRSLLLSLTIYDFPDGLLTSHEFEEIHDGEQRPEDIEEIREILSSESESKSSGKATADEKGENEAGTLDFSTVKQARKKAIELGITKDANFTGLNKQAIEELIEGIQRTRELFPDFPVFDFIGSCQEHNKILLNAEIRNHFINNKDYFRQKYKGKSDYEIIQILREYNKKDRTEFEVLAFSVSEKGAVGVSLNKARFSTGAISKTMKSIIDDVQNKWHPEGCDTIKSTVDHEMGHQIDNLISARQDNKIIKLFNYHQAKGTMKNMLSEYAGKDNDIEEFIAESWSEYQNNPKPREVARTVAERMIEIYKEKFSK